MSYDLSLQKDGVSLELETKHLGGTMPVGGYCHTDFNITYNYGSFYYETLDKEEGLRWLYGKTGEETIKRLEKAIEKLGTETSDNYWEPTEGNAGSALVPLLESAKLYTDAIWSGD